MAKRTAGNRSYVTNKDILLDVLKETAAAAGYQEDQTKGIERVVKSIEAMERNSAMTLDMLGGMIKKLGKIETETVEVSKREEVVNRLPKPESNRETDSRFKEILEENITSPTKRTTEEILTQSESETYNIAAEASKNATAASVGLIKEKFFEGIDETETEEKILNVSKDSLDEIRIVGENVDKTNQILQEQLDMENKLYAESLEEDLTPNILPENGQSIFTPNKSDEGGSGFFRSLLAGLTGGGIAAWAAKFKTSFMGTLKGIGKGILKGLSKSFLPLTIVASLGAAIIEGFKEYKRSGKMTDAIIAGLGGIAEFLSFGLIDVGSFKTFVNEKIVDPIKGLFDGVADLIMTAIKAVLPESVYNSISNGTKSNAVIKNNRNTGSLSKTAPPIGLGTQRFFNKGSGVDMDGLNPQMRENFDAMAKEYYELTGKRINVNSAFRSMEKQAKLYADFKAGRGAPANRPGTSLHNYGMAIDINSSEANKLDKLGLLSKYGFERPISREKWHLAPKGISLEAAKEGIFSADSPLNQASTAPEMNIRAGAGMSGNLTVQNSDELSSFEVKSSTIRKNDIKKNVMDSNVTNTPDNTGQGGNSVVAPSVGGDTSINGGAKDLDPTIRRLSDHTIYRSKVW